MDPLALLVEASEAANRTYDVLTDRVRSARAAGATWQAIGDAVGCSRQVAHYRWRRLEVTAEGSEEDEALFSGLSEV